MITERLKEKLKEVEKIVLEIAYLKNDIENINNGEEEYFETIIKNSVFWGRVFNLSKMRLVIDLCKLLAPKEDYSLKKLLNYANSNYSNINWVKKPENSQLKNCLNDIELIEKNYLSDLKTLRDKHFAHLDEDRNEIVLSTQFKDCWYVLEEIIKVFNELRWWVTGSETLFWPENEKPSEILIMLRYKKVRNYIQERRMQEPNNELLEKINNLMRGR